MSYQTTDKQRKLLESLKAENIPDDGDEASKLIEKLIGQKNSEGSSSKKSGGNYQSKTIEVVLPVDVVVDEPSKKDYLQKFVTADSIVNELYPSVERGSVDYFIKVYATVHDL